MANELIETDEEVEKAVTPGRRALRRRRLGGEKTKIINRLDSGMQRLGDGQRYRKLSTIQSRLGRVRKSTDPLTDLYTAIEKARGRGLLPKGGMMAGAQRMERDMFKRVARGPKIKLAGKRKENMDRAKREFSAVGRLRRRALSRAGK